MSQDIDALFADGEGRVHDGRQNGAEILAALTAAARERILVLDGAMGTQIQGLGFEESHFRGERFQACECHLRATTTC